MGQSLDHHYSDFAILEHEFYNYQKLADQKFLSARRMMAYRDMADKLKVASISVRRERRDHPMVQVIEDDRFTAAYAGNILNRDYDLVLSRNGEDGIIHYIESAPDIVLIDIHLPGLSGHEVLESIRAIDPQVFAVMLSVDTMKNNIVQAAEGGAHNFLKKPFSKERLLNIVKTSPYIQSIMRRNTSSMNTTH
jgi:CheY-like chemotaxis protein